MNIDPPADFDPGEALERLADPEQQRFGLSQRTWFYLVETCRAIESFSTPSFTLEPTLNPKDNAIIGCAVQFVIRSRAFLIDTGTRVRLWAALADAPDSDDRYLVHDGDASDPKVWEGLLVSIGRVEHFHVLLNHADRMRQRWSEWLIEQKRRGDDRGW